MGKYDHSIPNNILEIIRDSPYQGESYEQIGRKIGVHKSTLANAIAGRRLLPFHSLVEFCRVFEVSFELVYPDFENLYENTINKRLKVHILIKGKTMKEVAKSCGIDYRYFKMLTEGSRRPSKKLRRRIGRTLWVKSAEIF